MSDITQFQPETTYDIWHDRAVFHFLTEQEQIEKYLNIARKAAVGYLTIGTFSENGPEKCSGLAIKQYTEDTLSSVFVSDFETLTSKRENHITPFATEQNFVFCSFQRKTIKN